MDENSFRKDGISRSDRMWSHTDLQKAVAAVILKKQSKKKTAKEFGIPRSTLQRYIKLCEVDGGVGKKNLGRHTTLTMEQETELSGVLQQMEKRLYGLSPLAVRKIVFQFCEINNIQHSFNEELKCAGKKWLRLFLTRHPELSIRKPEGVSIQRALGYNRSKVKLFEEILKEELFHESGQRRIPEENIFNVDETGISVNHKPNKIVATKGRKSVSIMTSAERGKTITAVCCVSAAGAYCPPFFIFPRKRFKAELLDHGPVGAIGAANPSGWINEIIFTQWFDHFLNFFQPLHRSSPSLLILDGHASHTQNLELVNKARANNVELLVLPSHCTHKIQPLDVSVFKSLKAHYNCAVESWLHAHPGRAVQESHVAGLFAEAWGKAATVSNAVSGFKKARINPFMESTSDDEDYLCAEVTDIPYDSHVESMLQTCVELEQGQTECTAEEANNSQMITEVEPNENNNCEELCNVSYTAVATGTAEVSKTDSGATIEYHESTVSPTHSNINPCINEDLNSDGVRITIAEKNFRDPDPDSMINTIDKVQVTVTKTLVESSTSFHEIIPMPKAQQGQLTRRKRAVAHAKVITLSPYKRHLEDAAEKKNQKVNGRRRTSEKSQTESTEKKSRQLTKSQQGNSNKAKKERLNTGSKTKKRRMNPEIIKELSDEASCLYCDGLYSCSAEPWIRCQGPCATWSHMSCAGIEPKDKYFVCEFCHN